MKLPLQSDPPEVPSLSQSAKPSPSRSSIHSRTTKKIVFRTDDKTIVTIESTHNNYSLMLCSVWNNLINVARSKSVSRLGTRCHDDHHPSWSSHLCRSPQTSFCEKSVSESIKRRIKHYWSRKSNVNLMKNCAKGIEWGSRYLRSHQLNQKLRRSHRPSLGVHHPRCAHELRLEPRLVWVRYQKSVSHSSSRIRKSSEKRLVLIPRVS